MFQTAYIKQTNSTNTQLRELMRSQELPEMFLLHTDFQEAGKGQKGNSWESEKRKNLLFSVLLYPLQLAADEQYVISQLVSIAIVRTLNQFSSEFSIKWPNDIYWCDKKIGGILIENSLQNGKISFTIVGVGLNINQKFFRSDAPNPISLQLITRNRFSRKPILQSICKNINNIYKSMDFSTLRMEYTAYLYRKSGFHLYRDETEVFEAKIVEVQNDGKLILETKLGEMRGYYFKEVEFIIEN